MQIAIIIYLIGFVVLLIYTPSITAGIDGHDRPWVNFAAEVGVSALWPLVITVVVLQMVFSWFKSKLK